MSKNNITPPKIAEKLISYFLPINIKNTAIGDFEELYSDIFEESGQLKAWLWYWKEVAKSIFQYILNSIQECVPMFFNYMKIAMRIFVRHKAFSFINLAGLSVGMACCLMIFLHIKYELSFDTYHENSDRIYRVGAIFQVNGNGNPIPVTGPPVGPAMKDELPEVINAVRIYPESKTTLRHEDKSFFETGIMYTDASIFNIFSYTFIAGNAESALKNFNSIVLTETTAKRYFGDADPIGKLMKVGNTAHHTVTGVIKDVPPNSHFTFNVLLPFKDLVGQRGPQMQSWRTSYDFYTYILLAKNTDVEGLTQKLPQLIDKHTKDLYTDGAVSLEFFLQPMTDIHLYSHLEYELAGNSDISYIYIFSIIAFVILIIACINFMNLSTARSAGRAKEVGLRKVHGAVRKTLIAQFLGESILYSGIGGILAIVLTFFGIKFLNNSLEINYIFPLNEIIWMIPGLLLIIILTGVAAGSYPAFYLSSFTPINVLKGNLNTGYSRLNFRSALVVFQFVVSVSLIIISLIISDQLNFIRNKNLGFDKEHIVVLPMNNQEFIDYFDTIKNELNSYSGINGVTASITVPGEQSGIHYYQPEGFSSDHPVLMNELNVDVDFVKTMGLGLVKGRNFSADIPSDVNESVLINETAAAKFGWDDAIGKTITGNQPKKVIGVVKDFHLESLHKKITPLIITNIPGWYSSVQVKINGQDISGTLEFLEKKWKAITGGEIFEYSFLNDSFDKLYRSDEKLNKIVSSFTLFAVFVACLGLFGMSSYTAEQRTKEIGIRKILGASSSSIIVLLTKEIVTMIMCANIIAWPIVYLISVKWLEGFAYRISPGIGNFLLSSMGLFVIGLVTILFQSYKAANENPVNNLRNE